jgi:hypothetical protein
MAVTERTGFIHKRVPSIIAFALSLVYVLYCVVYWSLVVSQAGAIGALAFNIILPHLVCTALGFVFTTLALFLGKPSWSLAAGIAYIVAIVCFPGYWWCLIIQTILSFVAFYMMRKQQKELDAQLGADVAAEIESESIDGGDPADAWKDAQQAKAAAGAPVKAESVMEMAVEADVEGTQPVVDTPEGATVVSAEDGQGPESTTA